MAPRKARNTGYLVLVGCVALALVAGAIALQPYGSPLFWFIRGAAMLGYLAVFLAIVSSAYMRTLVRFFGRSFVQVHHILSVTGLILITLHPLGVAWADGTLRVFVPRFDSWSVFLQLGGRPAWYLFAIATLAAVIRITLGRNWRMIHFLNYVAFLLATIHGILIGTDFQSTIVRAMSILLAVVVVGVFVQKRIGKRVR
jgi:hypothetical protein